MAFDPLLDASGGFLSPYLAERRAALIAPPAPGTQSYFDGVDRAQAARQLPLPASPAAIPASPGLPSPGVGRLPQGPEIQSGYATRAGVPSSQTTLPYMGPQNDLGVPVTGDLPLPDIGLPTPPMTGPHSLEDPSLVGDASKTATGRTSPLSGVTAESLFLKPGVSVPRNSYDDLDGLSLYPRDPQSAPGTAPASAPPSGPEAYSPAQAPRGARQATDLSQEQLDAAWNHIVGGESGGNAHAKNPNSSAYGLGQMIDSTRDAFLASDAGKGHTVAEFKNSPELQRKAGDWLNQSNNTAIQIGTNAEATPAGLTAAWTLGVGGALALLQNPNENAVEAYNKVVSSRNGETALITNNRVWGITKDDTSAQALAKINAYYDKHAGAKQGGATSPPAGQTTSSTEVPGTVVPGRDTSVSGSTTPVSDQGNPDKLTPEQLKSQLDGTGPGQMGPGALPGYQPVTASDKMLALASGILQGGGGLNGLTNGLGKGLASMQQLGRDDQVQRFRFAQEAANTALAKERLRLIAAQAGAIPVKLAQGQQVVGIRQQEADTHEGAKDNAFVLGTDRNDNAAERNQLGRDRLNAGVDGSLAAGAAAGHDVIPLQKEMQDAQTNAAESRQQIADLRTFINADPKVVGSQATSRLARWAADNFGVDVGVNPDSASIAKKLVAQFNNTEALKGVKGTLGGRITQGEAGWYKDSAANASTTPGGWNALLDTSQKIHEDRATLAARYNALTQDPVEYRKQLAAPGGIRSWVTNQQAQLLAARGLGPDGHARSQYQQNPDAAGPRWTHVDPVTGLGATFH